MLLFELEVPPHVATVIKHFPPDLKKSLKAALRDLCSNPHLGETLTGNLKGLWKYKVRRYRIIYSIDTKKRLLQIYAVGHRKEIYDQLNS